MMVLILCVFVVRKLEQLKQALRKKNVFVNELEREANKGSTLYFFYSSAFREWLSNKNSYREWSGYKANASRRLPL